jgi:hypothetical protein
MFYGAAIVNNASAEFRRKGKSKKEELESGSGKHTEVRIKNAE